MEYQRPMVNSPQRDTSDAILLFLVFGVMAYFFFFMLGAWFYLKYPVFDFSHATGFMVQLVAHNLGVLHTDDILDVPNYSTWSAAIVEKAEIMGTVVLYSSIAVGWWLGWSASAPLPAEILIRGREVTNDPRKVQGELSKEGKADGILVHPGLAVSLSRERQHLLILGQPGAGKTQILLPIIGRRKSRG